MYLLWNNLEYSLAFTLFFGLFKCRQFPPVALSEDCAEMGTYGPLRPLQNKIRSIKYALKQ
jgi:hypothetical protein